MRLGISTASFYPELIESAVKRSAALGFRVLEVFVNSEVESGADFGKRTGDLAREYGMEIVAYHPYTSFAESFYFFSEYGRRTDESVELYKKYFHTASVMGARVFNVPGALARRPVDVDRYCEVYRRLYLAAAEEGLVFSQENVYNYQSGTLEFIRQMRARLGDGVAFTLDVKQANRLGIAPADMLDAMGDRLVHLHLSDFTAADDCLLPGAGCFDYRTFLGRLDRDGDQNCVIEVYRHSYQEETEILEAKDALLRYGFFSL